MIRRTLVCLSICLIGAGCGPDDDRNNVVITPGNNPTNNTNNGTTGTNNGSNNTILPINNGFGEACRGVECDDGFRCIAGVCVEEGLKVACENPDDLGVLTFGETYSGSGDTSEFADSIRSLCGPPEEEFSGAENAILFRTESDGSAEFVVTSDEAIEWLIEVREDCGDAGVATGSGGPDDPESMPGTSSCSEIDIFDFPVKANTDYFIIVEPEYGIDKGTFNWNLTLTQDICEQGRTCQDGDTILECFAGEDEFTYSCGGAGCNAGVCNGDACGNPIVVTGAMSWSGDAEAFEDNLNFELDPACGDGDEGYPTPGPEVVLSFPGMTAGQRIIVDASMNDDNDNAIFVLDSCGEMGCLASNDLGDRLEFDVTTDGDYFVVIDKFTNSPQTFNYTVDIQ